VSAIADETVAVTSHRTPARPASEPNATRGRWAVPLLLGAMTGALVAGRFETALASVAVALAAALACGARWPVRRWFGAVVIGSLLAMVLNLFLTPGRAIPGLAIAGVQATYEGLAFGALLALRLIGAMTAIQGLRAAWPGERAADEMARLLAPLERIRVPVGEARLMTGLALRFVPLLGEEGKRIAALQALRAGGAARGLGARLDRLRAALVPTLVAAVERAERTAMALEARHYRLRPLRGAAYARRAVALGVALAAVALLWRGS